MRTTRGMGAVGRVLLLSALSACFALTGEAAPKKAPKGAAKEKYSAAIVFPAKGNFDHDQGTVEAVFSPSYSAGDKLGQGSGMTTFTVLSLHGPKGSGRGEQGLSWGVAISQSRGNDRISMSSSRFERPSKYHDPVTSIVGALRPASGLPFKAGEWYSLAASWKRTEDKYALALYIDGKCVDKSTMPVSPMFGTAEPDAKDLLRFGNPRLMRGSLECLRLSGRARTPEEIAAASKSGLVKDADTRIFLTADTVAKLKTRAAEDLVNKEEKTIRVPPEGLLFGDVEFIPGRNGKAIKFPE